MKKVITITETWCDHPDCVEQRDDNDQKTQTVEMWLWTPGRGRKPNSITVDLCEFHLSEMKSLLSALAKYDQKVD